MRSISTTSVHHPLHSKRRVIAVPFGTARFLAAFEGIEGGFAIGSSIMIALLIAGLDTRTVLITSVISIMVSGFNTASVKYSSEHYLDQIDGREKKSALKHYLIPAAIEFVMYVALSLVTITPLLLGFDTVTTIIVSTVITASMLFVAGLWRSYLLHAHRLRDAIETAVLGMGIIGIGAFSGIILNSL